jgi:hypothetical protein
MGIGATEVTGGIGGGILVDIGVIDDDASGSVVPAPAPNSARLLCESR